MNPFFQRLALLIRYEARGAPEWRGAKRVVNGSGVTVTCAGMIRAGLAARGVYAEAERHARRAE
ncbi:MAG: hypothetical protein LBB61_03130 [Treponema sp.]|nr:hypothetical protein [Treponema sp.]